MKDNEVYTFHYHNTEQRFNPALLQPTPLENDRKLSVTALALDISGRCNLNCIYCAEGLTLPQRRVMSKEVQQKAINTLFDWAPKGSGVSVHLGSGEPLLQYGLVSEIAQQVRNLAHASGRQYNLHITTNGTLLTEEICNRLIEDGWRVKVSIDGGSQTHNRTRPNQQGLGTYSQVAAMVRYLSDLAPEQLSTTSVLCRGSNPENVFSDVSSLGSKMIEIVPVITNQDSQYTLTNHELEDYRQFILEYVVRFSKGISLPQLIRLSDRLRKVLGFGNSKVRCGAGRSFLTVGPEGNLFPCFRFVGLKDYRLGDLSNGIVPELAYTFRQNAGRTFDSRSRCKECWAATLCGGPCFAEAELFNQKNGEPPSSFCSMVKTEAQAAIWLTNTLRNRDPSRLIEYMGVNIDKL